MYIRMRYPDLFQCLAHVVGNRNFSCATAAYNVETHHGLTVEQCRRASLGYGVGDSRDLIKLNATAVAESDVHTGQRFSRFYRGDGAHGLRDAANVGTTTGGILLNLP